MPARKFTDEQELEICRRYEAGENTVQLGAAYGVTNVTIGNILKRNGAARRSSSESRGGIPKELEAEVCSRYMSGESTLQLGKAYGVTDGAIGRLLARNGVTRRSISAAMGGLPISVEAEVCRRYTGGESAVQLGEAYGVSTSYISRLLARNEVEIRSIPEATRKLTAEVEERICARYLAGEDTQQLGAAHGVGRYYIYRVLARNNVPIRPAGESNRKLTVQEDAEVCKRYVAGENTTQLSAAFEVSTGCILSTLERNGVPRRSLSEALRRFSSEEEAEICARYAAGSSLQKIGDVYGVSYSCIGKVLDRNGVPKRSLSEVQGGLSKELEAEVCKRYADGESSLLLSDAYGVSSTCICRIIARNGVKRRVVVGFGDSVKHALNCTGRYAVARECYFYVYALANYCGYSKPGITVNLTTRILRSEGQYGEEHLRLIFSTRQEAYFLEQAVLDATRGAASCPEDLLGWGGRREVRAMPAEDLVPIVLRLAEEMEELGLWEFAARYVPMTAAQRAICQQRALAGAPACAAAQ